MKVISAPSIKLVPDTDISVLRTEHNHLSDKYGSCEYQTFDGKRLLVFHGSLDGTIGISLEKAMGADIIVCCHPRQVIARYPELTNKMYRPVRKIGSILDVYISWNGSERLFHVEAKIK